MANRACIFRKSPLTLSVVGQFHLNNLKTKGGGGEYTRMWANFEIHDPCVVTEHEYFFYDLIHTHMQDW